ncbi:MAG TPA: hypothetical protein VHD32_06455 [Candidatus Didemnitutus sp.]|nr:hypothetical protein [Candidatus Didemnitutus sp.]
MRRVIAVSSLAFASLCATGLLWDIVQVVAWGRMFAGYEQTESFVAAMEDTFDGGRPCALCQAVDAARGLAGHELPAPTSPGRVTERVLFVADNTLTVVPTATALEWPVERDLVAPDRADKVPVPPPRA